MNRISIAVAFLGAIAFSSTANAENESTISVGYAQSHVKFDGETLKEHPKGVNLKYRYEIDSNWGVIGSFTYTHQDYNFYFNNRNVGNGDLDYYSLTAGPVYRFNDYISAYGLVGAAHGKESVDVYSEKYSESKTAVAYGAGLQINPVKNIAIDASYEYSKLDDVKVGTWMLGVGYRF